jgi:hypothetical protein
MNKCTRLIFSVGLLKQHVQSTAGRQLTTLGQIITSLNDACSTQNQKITML